MSDVDWLRLSEVDLYTRQGGMRGPRVQLEAEVKVQGSHLERGS